MRTGTDIHTNTIEGVFSLIKRGVMGTFHSVSRKHLPNYLNEFEFRWNTRKMDDGQRVSRAIRQVDGKRLEYRESVDNPPYLVHAEAARTFRGLRPEQVRISDEKSQFGRRPIASIGKSNCAQMLARWSGRTGRPAPNTPQCVRTIRRVHPDA